MAAAKKKSASKKRSAPRKKAATKPSTRKKSVVPTSESTAERGWFGPTWSPAEIARLQPHVINLRAGKFAASGDYQTTPADVKKIFDVHLPVEVAKAQAAGRKMRVLIWAHGGLVKEKSALQYALDHIDEWLSVGVYPIFFVWETGLKRSLGDVLLGRNRGAAERGFTDWTDTRLEKALHKAVEPVWRKMKTYAEKAAGPQGGARFAAGELSRFAASAGDEVEYYACGHSAGSIFHAHFLPVVKEMDGPAIRELFLLAPAITAELFKTQLQGLIGPGRGIDHSSMFTMDRETELDDNVAKIYRKSLLYFVMNACEPQVPTPILGLEEVLRDDPVLSRFFGLSTPSADTEVIWSPSGSSSQGVNVTNSTTHGGFDNDKDTLNSLARRMTGDLTATPFLVDRSFEAKRATGRRRAVCVGIDEYATSPLSGCVNDAMLWRDTLTGLGYDTQLMTNGQATHTGLVQALTALVGTSRPGDSLVFQYAGHGTQVIDVSGDEDDGMDEALVPFDYADGAFLIDDDIGAVLDMLPDGVSLTCFMDCCNSGSNTRALFRAQGNSPGGGEKIRFLQVPAAVMRKHVAFRQQTRGAAVTRGAYETRPEILFAACRPDQTAKEYGGNGYFTLAATKLLQESAGLLSNAAFHASVLTQFEQPPPNAQDPVLNCDDALRDAPLLFAENREVSAAPKKQALGSGGTSQGAVGSNLDAEDLKLIVETMHDYMKLLNRLS